MQTEHLAKKNDTVSFARTDVEQLNSHLSISMYLPNYSSIDRVFEPFQLGCRLDV
jgi:hypothetical protein